MFYDMERLFYLLQWRVFILQFQCYKLRNAPQRTNFKTAFINRTKLKMIVKINISQTVFFADAYYPTLFELKKYIYSQYYFDPNGRNDRPVTRIF